MERGNYIYKRSECDSTSGRNSASDYEEDKSGNIGAIRVKVIQEIENSEVNVPGYSVVRCDSENRNTGEGITLYIKDDIKSKTK